MATGKWVAMAVLCLVSPARALPPSGRTDPISTLSGGSTEVLARQLRDLVLEFLPDPLYEDHKQWNKQRAGPRGKVKNDGRWMKVRILGRDLAGTLDLKIEQVRKEPKRTLFAVVIGLDTMVILDRQTWAMGVRLYSGSTRARARVHLTLNCELTSRVEKMKGWLPEIVFRLRVLGSTFRHDHPVVEHTAGIGGDGARVLGELILGVVKAVKPNLERDLGKKLEAAIVKAGDTREMRVNFADLIAGKKPIATPEKPPSPSSKK